MSWKQFLLSDDILQVRKNTGNYLTARPKLNFIEGTNVTMTVADDNDEIDITINAPNTASTTFLELTDTPANYTSSAGKFVVVNSTPDALEFTDVIDCGTW